MGGEFSLYLVWGLELHQPISKQQNLVVRKFLKRRDVSNWNLGYVLDASEWLCTWCCQCLWCILLEHCYCWSINALVFLSWKWKTDRGHWFYCEILLFSLVCYNNNTHHDLPFHHIKLSFLNFGDTHCHWMLITIIHEHKMPPNMEPKYLCS